VPEEKRAVVEADIVERLIFARLLMLRATEADKVMGKELATKILNGSKQTAGSEEAFRRQLVTTGKTLEQVTDRLAEQATCEEVLNRELKSKITVTDAQAKKFYEENGPRFEQPESLRVTHILVSIKDQATKQDLSDEQKKAKKKAAEKLLADVKGGADFAKLARESSDDPRAKENGGAYTFARGQMPPEFEAAAFSMKPSQISDLVATDYGYHIIKLHEILPKQKVPLAEIAPKIKEALQRQELETQLPVYYQKLRKDAGIELAGEKSK
jgi:peptidyl-prolyl cis-trans isomerase C